MRGLSSTEEYMEVQRPFAENQDQDSQRKCQGYSSLRSRDMEDHSDSTKRIETVVNSCRRFVGVRWSEIISNEGLWKHTCQMPVEQEIDRYAGDGLVTLSANQSIASTRQILTWNQEEKRKRGRPRNTRRRYLEADV